MQDLGDIKRAAYVQAKAADSIRGLRLCVTVERIRCGVKGGVLQPQEHGTGVAGLAAPTVAETRVLAVVGAAPVIAVGASAAAAASAAKSASSPTPSSASEPSATRTLAPAA